MSEVVAFIIEQIADIGIAAIGNRIKDKRSFAPARDDLVSYLERQNKLNYFCTLDEEIDFGGLAQYIQSDLSDDMALRLFGNDNERTQAHRKIIEKAKEYASAHTNLSERRAVKLVSDTMNILRDHYRKGISKNLLFVEGEICDHIDHALEEKTSNIGQMISEATTTIIEGVGVSQYSLENNLALAQTNQFEKLATNLSMQEKAINATHCLAPYYGFKLEGSNRLVSIPLLKEATEFYPPGFQMNIKNVRVGNKESNKIDDSTFAYSYRHQVPIQFDIISAKKKLGDTLDPIQIEAEKMIGAHAYVYPKEFPHARAYSISVDDELFYDYLLMRTNEILEDGTAIISNTEQHNAPVSVTFYLNIDRHSFTTNMKVIDDDNKSSLKYRIFLRALSSGGKLRVKDLESNVMLVEGCPNSEKPKDPEILDQEIDLLEKLVSIEEFIGEPIHVPDEITVRDHLLIERIYTLVSGEEYSGKWTEFEIGLEYSDESRDKILEMEANRYMFMICQMADFSLFDKTFSLPLKREYFDAIVLDLDKLKEKVRFLDEGDSFKIKIHSDGENGSKYVDKLVLEEVLS